MQDKILPLSWKGKYMIRNSLVRPITLKAKHHQPPLNLLDSETSHSSMYFVLNK